MGGHVIRTLSIVLQAGHLLGCQPVIEQSKIMTYRRVRSFVDHQASRCMPDIKMEHRLRGPGFHHGENLIGNEMKTSRKRPDGKLKMLNHKA